MANLTIYDIIRGPVLTDKAAAEREKSKKLTLFVHPQANKRQIAQAVERLFEVKVEGVCTSVRKGKIKNVRMSRKTTRDCLQKKAIVRLRAGYDANLEQVADAAVEHKGEE